MGTEHKIYLQKLLHTVNIAQKTPVRWIAVGKFKNQTIEAIGKSEYSALRNWRVMALKRV